MDCPFFLSPIVASSLVLFSKATIMSVIFLPFYFFQQKHLSFFISFSNINNLIKSIVVSIISFVARTKEDCRFSLVYQPFGILVQEGCCLYDNVRVRLARVFCIDETSPLSCRLKEKHVITILLRYILI